METPLERATLYREQAAYCAFLLSRTLEPRRRALLERERQDWLLLADQDHLWAALALYAEPSLAPA
jgi:hypothetical protein